jgi:hypothetical protein
MAVRVTQVVLQVLHSGRTPVTGYADGLYDHNYSAYDGVAQGNYDLEIGQSLQGTVFEGEYFLAGFEQFEGPALQFNYALNAYEELETGSAVSGHYALSAYQLLDGKFVGGYQLLAFLERDVSLYGNYDLNAYEAADTVLQSEYDLQVYLLAQGYLQGLYDVDTYTDLLGALVSSYDYNTFEQNDQSVFTGTWDLLAWEQRDSVVHGNYALQVFAASTGYLDTESAIEVFEALTQKYDVWWDLNAYSPLQRSLNSSYQILTLKQLQAAVGFHWDLLVFQLFDGFMDGSHVLRAYEQEDMQTGFHYDLEVYLAKTGYLDAQHIIEALQAYTGYADGTYLLDTTQVLYTWIVNQTTGAPGRYEGYNFTGYAKLGEQYLAARSDGIFLLEGDDDAGTAINSIATIGKTDFEEPRLKRVTAAYLGLDSAGQVHLTLRTDAGQVSGPYELRQDPRAPKTERSKFKRGIKSRYWSVDMENANGGDVHLDGIEFETEVVANRRLKK